ncbi:MAG: heptosyltransferase [Chthoniobacter sp.]|jgi:lipopolysaccharide heptosyltransferase II|nr:heptosyltransferase [Chthoniobacter sp.]
MDFVVFLIYRIAVAVLCALPLPVDFWLGRTFGTLAYFVLRPYRTLVLRNLKIAFGGEKSAVELQLLAREHFATLGANLLCSFKVAAMPAEAIAARVSFENLDTLLNALRQGDGVVMVISHIGNWELFAQLAHNAPGHKFSTIYQALGNRHIDEHVKKARARFGVVPFDRREGFNAPIRFLREGGLVGVLVDQHAGDHGVWTPLFGRLASTSPLAATLAARTEALLIPVAIYTASAGRWRLVVSEPVPREGRPEDITAAINQRLEQQIRVSPRDWFWVHQRWKTPKPKFLLADYKRGIVLAPNLPAVQLKPFSILIRSSNWLGDAVMTVPAVRAIKQGRPDARVAILCSAKLVDFWKTVSEVDEVIVIEADDGLFGVAAKIRRDFDAAMLFPNSVRAALEVWLAGIPRRVGYRGKWRAKLLNQIVPERKLPAPPRHQVHHYLDLAQHVGATITEHLVETSRPHFTSCKIGLCAGAEYGPAKRWLPERFAEVALRVSAAQPCEWLLFGVEKDREVAAPIAEKLGDRCTNLIGKTTLAELIEQLRECRLLLTNDTGTMHLAAHLGVPVVAIFGSTEPALTGPLGAEHRVFRHHVECSPCFLRECPIDFRCMKAVTVEEVTSAVVSALETRGTAATSDGRTAR